MISPDRILGMNTSLISSGANCASHPLSASGCGLKLRSLMRKTAAHATASWVPGYNMSDVKYLDKVNPRLLLLDATP